MQSDSPKTSLKFPSSWAALIGVISNDSLLITPELLVLHSFGMSLCMPGGGQQPGVRLPDLHPRHRRRDRVAGGGGAAEQVDAGLLAAEGLGGRQPGTAPHT